MWLGDAHVSFGSKPPVPGDPGARFPGRGIGEGAAAGGRGGGLPAASCALRIRRGIEIGHIFQLGRKYAEALDLQVLDQNGRLVTVTMGSYGIGVSRAVAALAEQTYDEAGLCWPVEVAPADVYVVVMGKDPATLAEAERISAEAEAVGVRVILDDRRGASAGVKFKDAELIGVPTILVVGRGLADGEVELKDRASGDRESVSVSGIVETLRGRSAVVRRAQA